MFRYTQYFYHLTGTTFSNTILVLQHKYKMYYLNNAPSNENDMMYLSLSFDNSMQHSMVKTLVIAKRDIHDSDVNIPNI